MTIFHIKLFAITTMVIDHIGMVLFPDIIILRIVGRFSFPLFAWLIANGAYHTKNIQAYLSRLVLLALVSQIPYSLVRYSIGKPIEDLNIFFTLSLGLLAIVFIQIIKNNVAKLIMILLTSITAGIIGSSYGTAGVLSIILCYIFFKDVKKLLLWQTVLFVSFYTLPLVVTRTEIKDYLVSFFQPLGLISLFLIAFYNGREGRKAKYLFYLFYPLHLLILYLISLSFEAR